MVVRDRRVPLDGQLQLDTGLVCKLRFELPELPLGVVVDRVRDLDVLALHVQTHRASSVRVADESLSIYRTARAKQTTSTRVAPALRSACAAALAVAPLV